MTRRRNPPPRTPLRPQRSKEKEIDNDLRLARATRKAESMQKQQLRRQQWDNDYEEVGGDPAGELPVDDELLITPGDQEDEDAGEDDEDDDDRG